MKRIAIIHPEGNINNNPNLTGIVEILCEKNYEVDIYSLIRHEIYQKSPCNGSRLFLEDCTNQEELEKILRHKFNSPYSLVIGVDRGIIEAEIISSILGVPYGLISYEIFFADETGFEYKKLEIKACHNINFFIVQDEMREKLLCSENQIKCDNIFYIPVAGRGIKNVVKQKLWHKKYNIPADHKIAVYMGSVHKWAMIDEIIDYAPNIPSDWHIIIHNRYGNNFVNKNYIRLIENTPNIHLSNEIFDSFESMKNALSSSDLGLAFYNPIKGDKYAGKNIQHLGLSSGKISTYLQHGVPIATNVNYPFSDYIKKYNIGCYFEDIQELLAKLNMLRDNNLTENCILFFDEFLNLDNTIRKFLLHLNGLEYSENKNGKDFCKELLISNDLYINQEVIQPLIYHRNRMMKNNQMLTDRNLTLEDMILKFKNSTSFRLGNFLIKPLSFIKQIFK